MMCIIILRMIFLSGGMRDGRRCWGGMGYKGDGREGGAMGWVGGDIGLKGGYSFAEYIVVVL